MSTVIGSVTAITGLVVAIDADGIERTLALGDAIMDQDLIRPSMDAQIEISLDNASEPILLNGGQSWLATTDVFSPADQFPANDAIADVEAIQAALLAGQDPTEVLEPTAAGAPAAGGAGPGGGNEGADFVQLSRTVDETMPEAGYDTVGLSYTPPPVGAEEGLVEDEPAPEPPPPPAEPEPKLEPEPVTVRLFAVTGHDDATVESFLADANLVTEGDAAEYVVHLVDKDDNIIDDGGEVTITFVDGGAIAGVEEDYDGTQQTVVLGTIFSTDTWPDETFELSEDFTVSVSGLTTADNYESVLYGDDVTTTILDVTSPVGGDSIPLLVDEAIAEDSASDNLEFTAGNLALSSFRFSEDLGGLTTAAGLSWDRISDTEIQGSAGGPLVITLTLTASAIAVGETGNISVTAELEPGINLLHPGEVAGTDSLDLGNLDVLGSDGSNPDVTGTASLILQDDTIEITDLGNANLANAVNATASGDLEIDTGIDGMASLVFSEGGDMPALKTSDGKDVFYNPLSDGSLEAVDSDDARVFLLEADGDGGYTLTLSQMIEAPTVTEDVTINADTLIR